MSWWTKPSNPKATPPNQPPMAPAKPAQPKKSIPPKKGKRDG